MSPAPFVLLSRGSEGRLSERQSHLNLRANLLVEKGMAKMIQMVRRQNRADGMKHWVMMGGVHELGQGHGHLAEELDQCRECQKPGALRREWDCLVAEAPVQHRGPDLKHTMGAAGRPAHLFALVHAGTHQLVDGALGP